MRPTRSLRERFDEKWMPEPNSGCWLWMAYADPNGYGRMGNMDRRTIILAHRASWELHRGPIPPGMFVCHKCDTPPCVNPDHLFIGTRSDNINDCLSKGRMPSGTAHWSRHRPHRIARGERIVGSKLKESDVLEIRRLAGSYTQRAIGARFGVGQDVISRILSGYRWSHVIDELN